MAKKCKSKEELKTKSGRTIRPPDLLLPSKQRRRKKSAPSPKTPVDFGVTKNVPRSPDIELGGADDKRPRIPTPDSKVTHMVTEVVSQGHVHGAQARGRDGAGGRGQGRQGRGPGHNIGGRGGVRGGTADVGVAVQLSSTEEDSNHSSASESVHLSSTEEEGDDSSEFTPGHDGNSSLSSVGLVDGGVAGFKSPTKVSRKSSSKTSKHKSKRSPNKKGTCILFKNQVQQKTVNTLRKAVSKKPIDAVLRSRFIVTPLDGGGVSVTCRHCRFFNKPFLSKFNATKGRTHLVSDCPGIDDNAKHEVRKGSQAMKKQAAMLALCGDPMDTVQDMRNTAMQLGTRNLSVNDDRYSLPVVRFANPNETSVNGDRYSLPVAHFANPNETSVSRALVHPTEPVITPAEAVKVIQAEVKAIVARGEPPSRMIDDRVKAALMVRHGPSLGEHLPNAVETIYDQYVVPIDIASLAELEGFLKKLPGLINISLDGATVNGKQKVSGSNVVIAFRQHE